MKKQLAILALTATAVLSTSAALAAKPNKFHNNEQQQPCMADDAKMEKRFDANFKGLNLSEAQQAKIKQIQADHRAASAAEQNQQHFHAFKNQNEQYRAEKHKLITSKSFDEQAARQLIEKCQQERAQLEQERVKFKLQDMKHRHEIFQVLNAEQQKQFLENVKVRQENRAKMPKMGKDHQGNMQRMKQQNRIQPTH